MASGLAHAFYHGDGNGNIAALIYTNQSIAAKYEYDPYGNILIKIGILTDANLYRFSSKEYHSPSGLIYYLHRYYYSGLQRWVNCDPIFEEGGINLFAFVFNSPVSDMDPLGDTTLDNLNDPTSKGNQDDYQKDQCPACTPYAKGTKGYIGPHPTKPSAPTGAPRPTHYNLFVVSQQPYPGCHCFWNRLNPHYSATPGTVDLNNGFPTLSP